MDAFELNKIAGAVLAALLVVFSTKFMSDIIFHHKAPAKLGYEIEVADAKTGSGPAKAPEQVAPLAERLKTASIEGGQKLAKKCAACHTFESGGANKIGPNLYGVLDKAIAGVAGFAYSSAMKAKGGNWDYAALECFIENPKKCIPKTKMAFKGIKKPGQRADLILYLRSLSDNPAALPQ